jgi:endoglucanase
VPLSRRTITIAATVGLVAAGGVAIAAVSLGARADPPGPGTVVIASELSTATDAAADAPEGSREHAAAQYLSEQPAAVWLTPEGDPAGTVAERIAALAREARDQSARVAVVLYGLPDRDCGGQSAGGLDEDAYLEWVDEIGDALRAAADTSPIVVLEPDSLALAPECGNVEERIELLGTAVDALASDRIWIYVDGGHSDWLPAGEMASMIDRVDRAASGGIRGFATNVSSFQRTQDETAYAHDIAARLNGRHALIDTSRNGAGPNGEWCNPPERRVGEPGGTIGDEVVDTNLWIKPPGESDGTCNGGPPAGRWWAQAAIELTSDVLAH